MDNLDKFFEHTPPVDDQTETIETPEIVTETVEETAPEVTAEAAPEAKIEPKGEPDELKNWAPVSVVIEHRNKAKAAQDEADELRRQLADLQAKQNAPNIPDPYDDPQNYHAYVQQEMRQQIQQEMAMEKLNQSRARAVEKYGADTITELAAWAGTKAENDPSFEASIFAQPDPVEWIIDQKKRADLFKSFEADPDAYVRQRAVELGLAEISHEEIPAQTTMAKKPSGPPSLNNAKSRDAAIQPKPEDAFDAIFRK